MRIGGALRAASAALALAGCHDFAYLSSQLPDLEAPPDDLAAPPPDLAIPDLTVRCTQSTCLQPTPVCDSVTGRCVACLTDPQCQLGTLCQGNSCVPGCTPSHGCGATGECVNGMCKICTQDADCGGGTPRCDRNLGRCVRCLPGDDNCPAGSYCAVVAGGYQCEVGCKGDGDCPLDGGLMLCCGHRCTDPMNDVAHCGACGVACQNGQACCAAACLDIGSDPRNCGACGRVCSGGHANWACGGGNCTVAGCQGGFRDCNGIALDGCEADITGDLNHCGGCGMRCSFANAQAACMNGACMMLGCLQGFANCDGFQFNGCEVNLAANAQNCGVCGKSCPAVPNGFPGCVMSVCGLGGCIQGFDDCDKQVANGCEIAIATDVNNCGVCGMRCPVPANATASCLNGQCAFTCNAGFADCDKNAGNGCEAQPDSDVANCGVCGRSCSSNNLVRACSGGVCNGACNAGFADCNGNKQTDGCEVNLNTDVNNCSTCGRVCSSSNIARSCAAGVCNGTCNAGFADCNGNKQGDGCEINTNTDKANCGGCGKPCANNLICSGGLCVNPPGCFKVGDVLQQGLGRAQYTRCAQVLNNGYTCVNPGISYGNNFDGIPGMDVNNNYDAWCKQLGCNGYSFNSVQYGVRDYAAPFGKVYWCSGFDDNAPHWCDKQDGFWYNSPLDFHPFTADAIVQITCN
jgi:Stigma-specific protein, Stig1